MDSVQQFEFDLALSYLRGDLGLALELAERLTPELRVALHPRGEETVTATDGLESWRTVFRERARLSVVLYREGWGHTPWSAVEAAAIRERGLATDYRSLVLVNLDSARLPAWLPQTLLQIDPQRYSTDELIGVIKARAQELGAQLQRATSAERAAALERRRAFDAETARLLGTGTSAWLTARDALLQALRREAQDVAARTGWEMECGRGVHFGGYVVVLHGQSIELADCALASTARDAYLELREYDARLAVERPGSQPAQPVTAAVARSTRLDIRRLPALGWCWEMHGRVLSTSEAAETIVGRLRERVERELRPKSWEP